MMKRLQLKQLHLLLVLLDVERLFPSYVLYEQILCSLVEVGHHDEEVGGDLLADPAGIQAVGLLDHFLWRG